MQTYVELITFFEKNKFMRKQTFYEKNKFSTPSAKLHKKQWFEANILSHNIDKSNYSLFKKFIAKSKLSAIPLFRKFKLDSAELDMWGRTEFLSILLGKNPSCADYSLVKNSAIKNVCLM